MKSRKLSTALLIAGVALFLGGVAWPFLFPKDLLWDDARAQELTTAADTLHATMHAHNHAHDDDHLAAIKPDDHPEVIAAAQKYQDAQAGLATASFWTNEAPTYIRWSGLALCVVGVAVFMTSRKE